MAKKLKIAVKPTPDSVGFDGAGNLEFEMSDGSTRTIKTSIAMMSVDLLGLVKIALTDLEGSLAYIEGHQWAVNRANQYREAIEGAWGGPLR